MRNHFLRLVRYKSVGRCGKLVYIVFSYWNLPTWNLEGQIQDLNLKVLDRKFQIVDLEPKWWICISNPGSGHPISTFGPQALVSESWIWSHNPRSGIQVHVSFFSSWAATSLCSVANIHVQLGDTEEAIESIEEAMTLIRDVGANALQARLQILLTQVPVESQQANKTTYTYSLRYILYYETGYCLGLCFPV